MLKFAGRSKNVVSRQGDIGDMAKREAKQFRQVYFIEAVDVGLVKIGCANDARARLRELQVGSPCKLELKGVYHVDDAHGLEAGYHNRYAHLHSHGEWFRIDDDLRRLIDDSFGPDEDHIRICARPTTRATAAISVNRLPGEDDDAFTERATNIVNASMEFIEGDVYLAVVATH